MALRCFLFSSDEGTSDVIRQVMTGLGVEGESCAHAATAVEKVAQEGFQLLVIDWEQQPEAGMLLSAARERKASERPLILAVVRDDAGAQKVLQAGANSILRKPLLRNQVTDTLTTARDLLRSRQESAASAANAAAAGAGVSSAAPAISGIVVQPTLRAGEFLQTAPLTPSAQIESASEVAHFPEQSLAEPTDPLEDLEPVAAAVAEAPPSPPPDKPKGLDWYLKARRVEREPGSVLATSPARPHGQKADNQKPELLGYDQTPSSSGETGAEQPRQPARSQESAAHLTKQEAQLFSYISGEKEETAEPTESKFRIGKKAIIAALVLAACAIVAAPQAPWHRSLSELTSRGKRALHGWLNPQPVTAVTQAPASHEDFRRPGDEYKLPVAENIPDATTDPSQINVVPVVDPTAKKPPADTSTEQPAGPPNTSATSPGDGSQANPVQTPAAQPEQNALDQAQPTVTPGTSAPTAAAPDTSAHPDIPAAKPTPIVSAPQPPKPAPRPQPTPYTPTTKVPSSLKSQMATMVPDASGDKPVDAALPSIEPVEVPELTERALLIDQPPLAYPPSAGGKQGTVTLQVLIGRDGMVQDAKFLQGSLVFARAAINGVKQWKFKPYTMNNRPVSVQTSVTIKFAPAQ